MIYITGDTHGGIDIHKLSSKVFKEQENLTKDDYVIVCGDFGFVWDGSQREKWHEKWLQNKNFTTLWVDGNHENYDMLAKIPTKEMFGGIVQETSPGVYHLMRGQVYNIEGKKIYTMGGAESTDKMFRTEHTSWWEQEIPSKEEIGIAMRNLDAAQWNVDYVITHCAPRHIDKTICPWGDDSPFSQAAAITSFHEHIAGKLSFKEWFFGHYHIDAKFGCYRAVYNDVVPIE